MRVLDEAGAIAADGKCRSFDDSADGYGRGEGAGVVILKRLDKALIDGDHVLAILKGSAVGSDGKTVGIMAPNAIAQQLVARKALYEAKITADSIQYIEAHTTSTSLGDPTETDALAEIYGLGSGRETSNPCYIGSVKSNIGHLEAGAAVMGLIKAVMVLQQGLVPPQANLQTLNRKINWKDNLLRPCMETTKLSPSPIPARAAIASYGYSGTVSHAIIEAAPPSQQVPTPVSTGSTSPVLLLLSAPQANRLPAAASALKTWLQGQGESVSLEATATTLARHRAHHRFRNAIVAESVSDAIAALDKLSQGVNDGYIVKDRAAPEATKGPVWVFSGHGAQWAEMGQELYRSRSAFFDVVQQLEPIIRAELGFSAIDTIHSGNLDRSDIIQAMTFLMHLGIAAVLREEAGPPSAVVGHSLGETAAAIVSGALTWHEGALIVCRRARLYREVMGQGAMILVRLSVDEARSRIGTRPDISIAIDASLTSCVVSGAVDSVRELADAWKQEGIEVHYVASDVPFHSQLLSKLADPLRDALHRELHPRLPQTTLYSTSQSDPRLDIRYDVEYWVNNMIHPVRLQLTMAAIVQDGFRVFMEVSSHPIVTNSIHEIVSQETEETFLIVPTMVRKWPVMKSILTSIGRLHCFGCPVAYIDPHGNAAWLSDVPGTLWNHQPFYKAVAEVPRAQNATHDPFANDLLGTRTVVWGTDQVLFQTRLDEDNRPFPGHHPLHGSEIVPAAVLINTFLRATSPNCLEHVSLKVPVVVSPPREI
jgi:6-methylsalicylic acid synthase